MIAQNGADDWSREPDYKDRLMHIEMCRSESRCIRSILYTINAAAPWGQQSICPSRQLHVSRNRRQFKLWLMVSIDH